MMIVKQDSNSNLTVFLELGFRVYSTSRQLFYCYITKSITIIGCELSSRRAFGVHHLLQVDVASN
jgi:hypothetical protein